MTSFGTDDTLISLVLWNLTIKFFSMQIHEEHGSYTFSLVLCVLRGESFF